MIDLSNTYLQSIEPIFIFSCPRSGSSLLSRLLNSHSNISIPFESHLFYTFYPWLKYYGDLRDKNNQKRLVGDILSTEVIKTWQPPVDKFKILNKIQVPNFGGIVDAVLSSWADLNGKKRWGEKTPRHLFHWKPILSYFPNSKVIHILRDGRDVATSWIDSRFGPKTYFRAAKEWIKFLKEIENLKKEINENNFYEIKYEKLISDTERELKKICSFVEEDYESQMLYFYENKSPYPTDKINLQNLQKPIIANNKGKWQTRLSKKELYYFESIAGEYLEKYNYPVVYQKPQLENTEIFFSDYVEHPAKKAIAMAKNRIGHKDAYDRVKIFIKLLLK
jgi:hypothetical protein